MFFLLILSHSFLLEGVHMLVLRHIDEEFALCPRIFGLDDEPLLWLNRHTTFSIDLGFSTIFCRLGLPHLVEEISHLRRAVPRLYILIDLH